MMSQVSRPALPGTRVTAAFLAAGRLAGSSGCNNYFSTYRSNGKDIAIDAPGAARSACAAPRGAMEQEDNYLFALSEVNSYQIEGDRLRLTGPSGATELIFLPSGP